jgi:hypothetical protein
MQIHLKLLKIYPGDSPTYSSVCHPSYSLSFPENMMKTQEGMTDPRFRRSASDPDSTRLVSTCICSMHYRGHAHSCYERIWHLDRNTGRVILLLAPGAQPAVRQSKSWHGMTNTSSSGLPNDSREAKAGKFLGWWCALDLVSLPTDWL